MKGLPCSSVQSTVRLPPTCFSCGCAQELPSRCSSQVKGPAEVSFFSLHLYPVMAESPLQGQSSKTRVWCSYEQQPPPRTIIQLERNGGKPPARWGFRARSSNRLHM
ncbi:hypothetical protein LEMLEM_LOCUS2781 [Lemmus lemmus]